jgi:hypothetical protein
LNDSFELPSLEQIEEMDRQQLQAIQALEISASSVKCQRCSMAVPIVGKLARPYNVRIAILQKRIKWIEEHYYYHHHHRGKDEDIKALKQELAELLEEDAKYDKLRSNNTFIHFCYLFRLSCHKLASLIIQPKTSM